MRNSARSLPTSRQASHGSDFETGAARILLRCIDLGTSAAWSHRPAYLDRGRFPQPTLSRRPGCWLLFDEPFAVHHRGDDHPFRLNPINNTIAVGKNFADGVVIEFGHFASTSRELAQISGQLQDCAHYCAGVGGRIGSNVFCNPFHIRRLPAATTLLAKPSAETHFRVFLRNRTARARVFQAVPDLLKYVQVVLDIF